MTIRPVRDDDVPVLAEFWYDQMALYSQKQSAIRLLPDAIEQWQNYAYSIILDDAVNFLLIEFDSEIVGAIIGRIDNNQVGLSPKKYGVIDQIILDLHSPHKRRNAIHRLLNVLKEQFYQQGISHIVVQVPSNSLVEQGFWRGLGATHINDSFWMEI